jgi:hypothetical protein
VSAEAIYLATHALRARLQSALTAAGDTGTVFVGPLDDPAAAGASLILFLYRLVPNPSLRNSEHRVPVSPPPPPYLEYQNATALDLFYLITVGTRAGTGEEPLLRVLGYALRELQTDPLLVGSGVGHQTVRLSLEPLSIDEVSRVWALFPTANYRTSVAYMASPVWIDPISASVPAAPVVQSQLRGGLLAPQEFIQ